MKMISLGGDPQESFAFEWSDENGFVSLKDPNEERGELALFKYRIATWSTSDHIPVKTLLKALERIEQRLAILDVEKTPEIRMLRDTYNRYKMIEGLLGKDDE
jgi:hypothetical protein